MNGEGCGGKKTEKNPQKPSVYSEKRRLLETKERWEKPKALVPGGGEKKGSGSTGGDWEEKRTQSARD